MYNLIKKQHQYLFKQTNYQHRKLSKIFVFFCFIFLFVQINQIKSTYTNGFIDHKTLLTPKQLITNTLKQIKPKFNPRYSPTSSKTNDQKKQKLNVYDLNDGIKTARKTNNKEQVPQSTYYYTDYKPIVKKLVPMKPECPETGRTVCKDAKAYPSESILNLILEAKANKFNFSTLFVDESQSSDMPNLPEIESTISKCGQQNDKEYDKAEKTYDGRKTITKNNNENYNENYNNRKNNYKRPDSSSVYYDNENTYSTHNTLNDNYPANNYEQQRINDNSYDKIDQIDQTKQYDQMDNKSNSQQQINYQSGEQLPSPNPLPIQQRQIYQQPQSSIKFEQHYNRQPTQIRHDKPIQDLDYRNLNQNNYYNERNRQQQRSENPFKTRVTIIPFIHYITQIPKNGYRLNSDKHLIDTITQSLQNNPLNNYTPDAWLPIKAYTTEDLQQKEIDEHLASDRIGSDDFSNDELTSEYSTLNYRDKRSTCTDEEEIVKNDNQIKKKDDENKKQIKKEDDDSSLTRVKKQAGFEEEPEELCKTKRLFITPKAALNDKSEWRYIVNVGERDSRLKQVIKVDVCANPNGPCSNQISLPFGYVSVCKQKYIKKKLLSVDPDGQSTSTENFFIPSCCVCEINRVNQK